MKILLRFESAEINQVIGDTESAFLALRIAINWAILLDADMGVHNGWKEEIKYDYFDIFIKDVQIVRNLPQRKSESSLV